MSKYFDTIKEIQEYASKHDAVLVSFSGGKDSIVVLDLCLQFFKRVEAFYFYLDPHSEAERKIIDFAYQCGVPVKWYPNRNLEAVLASGWYGSAAINIENNRLTDQYKNAREESGISLVATGHREGESFSRRALIKRKLMPGWQPIRSWSKEDVIGYIRRRGIPEPLFESGGSGGPGFNADYLDWLSRFWPNDYARLKSQHPYVGTILARKKLYFDEASTR